MDGVAVSTGWTCRRSDAADRVMAGVTILICIFVAVLAYFITSGMVSSRIERLTHFMQEVQEGSMDMQMEAMIGMKSGCFTVALAA